MSFSKFTLEQIKNKILLSSEIEKRTRITKKGQDYWCCCIFHKEKTPSMKINDELGSFYCFGCGAKGDIFTFYTDFYKYQFQEAVTELASKAGISLEKLNYKQNEEINFIKKILESTSQWYEQNLELPEASICRNYLKKRNLSKSTIKKFRLGYSYNSQLTLLEFLKKKSFEEEHIISSNVIKIDKNKKPKNYFFKRLIFPIMDERSNIVGFGGRSLDDTQPKYINSPESTFFQKRYLLYNLSNAKISTRKKNNLLVCEGYMDVISLFNKGIESVVSSLGTALTEQQLKLSWKYCSKPTLMFDGDSAGRRAAYKVALMALRYLSMNKFIQFISLPQNEDPDSFVNNFSRNEMIQKLKTPLSLVDFIFYQASLAHPINSADDKIMFDKYIDDIVTTIQDRKIKYFYRNEFKSLFFEKIRNKKQIKQSNKTNYKPIKISLIQKQIYSFVASYINHKSIRKQIMKELKNFKHLDETISNLLNSISSQKLIEKSPDDFIECIENNNHKNLLKKCLKNDIYQLFPYSSVKFDSLLALVDIKESCKNLKRRLSNSQEIATSLESFLEDSNQLNWEELQKINKEIIEEQEL